MATGTVKWFNETKGYGFIQPDSGGKDVFVHISAVERSGMSGLAEGMKITYDVEAGSEDRQGIGDEPKGGVTGLPSRPARPASDTLVAPAIHRKGVAG